MTILLAVEALLWLAGILYAARTLRFAGMGERLSSKAPCGGVPVPVTVVILAQEQEDDLRRNLPLYIGQEYGGGFNIIVVDIRSTDGTRAWLEEMEETYPMLTHTSVPLSARDISLQRLAMTLGFRAAATDWVVFTDAGCTPPSAGWLSSFVSQCADGRDAVLGMTVCQGKAGRTGRRWQFFRLWQQALWMPRSLHGVPYRADDSLFAYRRSHFMSHSGFGSDSNLLCGAAALLFNRHVAPGRCGLSVAPDSILHERPSSDRNWRQERLYFMETRRHLRHVCAYRLLYSLCAAAPAAMFLVAAAATALSGAVWQPVVAWLLWLTALLVRGHAFRKACLRYGIRTYTAAFPVLEAMIPLWDASAWLRWRFVNKNMFRKKFV